MKALCKHNQSGFCKIGEKNCSKRHNNEICSRNNTCDDPSCEKRHPKICKYFVMNHACKFNQQCAYLHIENKTDVKLKELEKEIVSMKEEIQDLATSVKKMVEKVGKVLEIKSINTLSETKYQCDHCSLNSKTERGLKCHITKKHNIETLRTAYIDTSLHFFLWTRGLCNL